MLKYGTAGQDVLKGSSARKFAQAQLQGLLTQAGSCELAVRTLLDCHALPVVERCASACLVKQHGRLVVSRAQSVGPGQSTSVTQLSHLCCQQPSC
jgi:hypothetical protein